MCVLTLGTSAKIKLNCRIPSWCQIIEELMIVYKNQTPVLPMSSIKYPMCLRHFRVSMGNAVISISLCVFVRTICAVYLPVTANVCPQIVCANHILYTYIF